MNTSTEIWKPVPAYEGLYEASSLGRIRGMIGGEPLVLEPIVERTDRKVVYLYDEDGRVSKLGVTSLLNSTFEAVSKPRVSVLTAEDAMAIYRGVQAGELQQTLADEFDVTQRTISSIAIGQTWSHVTGHKFVPNPKRQLSEDDVLAIDAALRAGATNADLAAEFCVTNQLISNIRRGRNWTSVTGRVPTRRNKL